MAVFRVEKNKCFSANKTFPNAKTTRKIDLWTEKSAKKEGACASP